MGNADPNRTDRSRLRFRVHHILLLVLLVSVGLTLWLDHARVSQAEYLYDRQQQLWHAGRESLGSVIDKAEVLFDAEVRSLWLSRRSAACRMIDRLEQLLGIAEKVESHATRSDSELYRAAKKRMESRILELQHDCRAR